MHSHDFDTCKERTRGFQLIFLLLDHEAIQYNFYISRNSNPYPSLFQARLE
jgi:hypothetical protein